MREYLVIIRQAWRAYQERGCRADATRMTLHLVTIAVGLGVVLAWLTGVTGLDAGPVSDRVHALIGANAGGLFDNLLANANTTWKVWLPVAGVFAIAARSVVAVVQIGQSAMNSAAGVRVRSDKSKVLWVAILGKRLAGMMFAAVTASALLASFSAKTALEVLDYLDIGPVADSPWAFRAGEVVVALALATLLFGVVFRFLPDAKLKFRVIWHSAFWAAKLYTLVQVGAAFAIVYVGGLSLYGEAAVLPVLLGYLYFTSASFLWGAQVLRVDLQRHDMAPEPSAWAVRIPPQESRALEAS